MNSLKSASETTTSITGTLFFGSKLWKGAVAYFNPELSGGSGFSKTTGVAGFPNGEVYRVSDPTPHIYIARLYFTQIFPLTDKYEQIYDGINQLAQSRPSSYLSVSAGKYSIMDFFDNNKYSHDPRTQFYNWALMGNGAWDYPANTRGYTFGLTFELVKPDWALRFSTVMVPLKANGSVMDLNIKRSRSEAFEFEHKYNLGNHPGTIRLMTYLTQARMGNYRKAIEWGVLHNESPVIDSVGKVGRTKYGFGINIEQQLSDNIGVFARAGWNDGHNETWVFTEIDRHISAGLMFSGVAWNRKNDNFGISQVINWLSEDHKNYLMAGGYGFIIGDGNLNYNPELITELFYSFRLRDYPFWISPDYQFILDPAYNKDRGPVHAFGLRAHLEF
jgi:high affinity Mn2+ porin